MSTPINSDHIEELEARVASNEEILEAIWGIVEAQAGAMGLDLCEAMDKIEIGIQLNWSE